MVQFSRMTMPPFTQLELFSDGLKSMKVNFNIFPGQHNHQIWASLNHCYQFRRLEWGPDSHLQHLEDVLQEEWYKILLETVQNLYESILRRIETLLKAKGGPTPY
jgi:hypothetical protein